MLRDIHGETKCGADGCERALTDPQLVFDTEAGRQKAYECGCGAVTVTVARPPSSDC